MSFILIAQELHTLPYTVPINKNTVDSALEQVSLLDNNGVTVFLEPHCLINLDSETYGTIKKEDGEYSLESVSPIGDFLAHISKRSGANDTLKDYTSSVTVDSATNTVGQALSTVSTMSDSDHVTGYLSNPRILFQKSDQSLKRIVYHDSSWQTLSTSVSNTEDKIGIATPDSWWFDSN